MVAEYIYLATHDPHRGMLLARIGVRFEALHFRAGARADPEVSDELLVGETPLEHVHRVAQARALGGVRRIALRKLRHSAVMGCATVIDLDGQAITRPTSAEQAAQTLRRLSGRSHRVLTVVVIADQARSAEAVSASDVRFSRLGEVEIEHCLRDGIAAEEPGAYSLLGAAGAWIEDVRGSASGIMGLPLQETYRLVQNFGSVR